MSHETLRRLRTLRTTEKRITPDAAWVRATRAMLLTTAQKSLPTQQGAGARGRLLGAFRVVVPQGMGTWVHRPMLAVLSVLIAITGGSIMSVSAAEEALPGDLLYSLKLATEQARLVFTPVKEDRLKLKTEFTSRRVSELQNIAIDAERPQRVVAVAEILKSDLNTLKNQLNEVAQDSSSENAAAAARLVDKQTNAVITALQSAKAQMSPENIEIITEAQSAAADAGVKAIEVLAETHILSSETVSVEDVEQALKDHAKVVSDVTTTSTSLSLSLTTQILTDISSTSSLLTTTTTLSGLVGQVKDATASAFAQQKVQDQLATAATTTTTTPVIVETSSSTTSTVSTQTPSSTPVSPP